MVGAVGRSREMTGPTRWIVLCGAVAALGWLVAELIGLNTSRLASAALAWVLLASAIAAGVFVGLRLHDSAGKHAPHQHQRD